MLINSLRLFNIATYSFGKCPSVDLVILTSTLMESRALLEDEEQA